MIAHESALAIDAARARGGKNMTISDMRKVRILATKVVILSYILSNAVGLNRSVNEDAIGLYT